MEHTIFKLSFRCFYPDSTEPTKHFQPLKLSDIPRWIDAYKFTHPNCQAITVKIWFSDLEETNE